MRPPCRLWYNRAPVDVLRQKPPTRPANVNYASIYDLYLEFENIFLVEGKTPITSPCGHSILIFDHHFFHMAAVNVAGKDRLFMKEEKAHILAATDGFGQYTISHGGSRARHLLAARETLSSPDEVWEDNPKAKARWVYIKEYAAVPYPFSIALVTLREEEAIIVPVTSFACKKNDVKKWRQGKKIYPENTKAAISGGSVDTL